MSKPTAAYLQSLVNDQDKEIRELRRENQLLLRKVQELEKSLKEISFELTVAAKNNQTLLSVSTRSTKRSTVKKGKAPPEILKIFRWRVLLLPPQPCTDLDRRNVGCLQ